MKRAVFFTLNLFFIFSLARAAVRDTVSFNIHRYFPASGSPYSSWFLKNEFSYSLQSGQTILFHAGYDYRGEWRNKQMYLGLVFTIPTKDYIEFGYKFFHDSDSLIQHGYRAVFHRETASWIFIAGHEGSVLPGDTGIDWSGNLSLSYKNYALSFFHPSLRYYFLIGPFKDSGIPYLNHDFSVSGAWLPNDSLHFSASAGFYTFDYSFNGKKTVSPKAGGSAAVKLNDRIRLEYLFEWKRRGIIYDDISGTMMVQTSF